MNEVLTKEDPVEVDRVVVEWGDGELDRAADQALDALLGRPVSASWRGVSRDEVARSRPKIFRRGNDLVRVTEAGDVLDHTHGSLKEAVARVAILASIKTDPTGNVTVTPRETPPRDLIDALLHRTADEYPGVPALAVVPEWSDGELLLPARLSRNSDAGEERARECWREIVQTATRQRLDALAIVLGAAYVSPFLSPLGLPGFTVNMRGDTTTGKTSSSKVALSIWEETPSDGQEPNWDQTKNAICAQLARSGLLPVLLDETGAVSEREPGKFLSDVVMRVSSGQDRARSTRSGALAAQRQWRLVVVSTGERSLMDGGTPGVAARLVEMSGPFMPDAGTADRLVSLAREAWGWPARWAAAGGWRVPDVPKLESPTSVGARLARSVAASAAGFESLSRLVGVTADARELGDRALETVSAQLDERGTTAGDRFWDALTADLAANPRLYEGLAIQGDVGLRLHGKVEGDELFVLIETCKELAESVGCDVTTAVRDLIEDGRAIHPEKGRGFAARKSVGGGLTGVYVFDAEFAGATHVRPGVLSGFSLPVG